MDPAYGSIKLPKGDEQVSSGIEESVRNALDAVKNAPIARKRMSCTMNFQVLRGNEFMIAWHFMQTKLNYSPDETYYGLDFTRAKPRYASF